MHYLRFQMILKFCLFINFHIKCIVFALCNYNTFVLQSVYFLPVISAHLLRLLIAAKITGLFYQHYSS